MPNPKSPQARARARAQQRTRDAERRKRIVTVIAGILAAAFIASLGAFGLRDRGDDANQTPTPTPISSESSDPAAATPTPSAVSCQTEPPTEAGELLVDLEQLDDATLIAGEADLSIDGLSPAEGQGSLRVEIGQRTTPATVRASFPQPIDIQGRSVWVWLRQNGNLQGNGFDWRVRLGADAENFLELVLDPVAVNAATQWCGVSLQLDGMGIHGHPDVARIRYLEVVVPRYPGAGAGNIVWLDAVTLQ